MSIYSCVSRLWLVYTFINEFRTGVLKETPNKRKCGIYAKQYKLPKQPEEKPLLHQLEHQQYLHFLEKHAHFPHFSRDKLNWEERGNWISSILLETFHHWFWFHHQYGNVCYWHVSKRRRRVCNAFVYRVIIIVHNIPCQKEWLWAQKEF